MKNFFKKLSFVLALALLVSAIAPAGKASAAAAPTLKKSSKVLYIGGDKTGNIGDTYRFTFNNAAGYTATWKSSKKTVATVDAKSGNIQAVGVGTTVIKATLTNKANKAVELTAKVYVKQNAEKIGFGSLAAFKEALAVGDSEKANVYRQVGTTKVWKQTDKTVTTDVIKWSSSNTDVATVDTWGKVTAVAAGEATITATAKQSEGSTVTVAPKSFKVKVQAGLTDASQKGIETINVTFASDLSTVVKAADVNVFSVTGTAKVKVLVKALDFDKVDKTKAVITTYNPLVKDTQYVVEYADTEAGFVGADVSADAVASIDIVNSVAETGKIVPLEIKAYDKNGVDITSAAVLARVDVSVVGVNTDAFLDATAKTINFWAKDKKVTLKATFHTQKYDATFAEITITKEKEIVSQDASAATVSSIGAVTIAKAGEANFEKATTRIALDDQTSKIFIKTKNSADADVTETGFKFYTTDATKLIVGEDGSLYPVKSGVVVGVIAKYNDVTIDVISVTIGEARTPSQISVKPSKSNLSLGVASDKLVLEVTVLDQYDKANNTAPAVAYVSGPAGNNQVLPTLTAATADGVTKYTFLGTTLDKEGYYQYKFTVNGKISIVGFTVGTATAATNYSFSEAGKIVDTALKLYSPVADSNKTASKAFDMILSGYASTGYKTGEPTVATTKALAYNAAVAVSATTGTAIYVEVLDKDGNVVALDGTNNFIKFASNKISVDPILVSGGAITKLATGNYSVRAYEVTAAATLADAKTRMITLTSFVVTDTQAKVDVTINGINSTLASTSYQTVLDDKTIATLKIGTVEVNSMIKAGSLVKIGEGKSLAITKATLEIDVFYGQTATYDQEFTVGASVNFAN